MKEFDYIIAGAGCAGLSLVMEMIRTGHIDNKRVLIVDKDPKQTNDRTWCFWETKDGPFESIVFHQWRELWFHDEGFSNLMNVQPYRYKMIRGLDFYNHCLEAISKKIQIVFTTGEIKEITDGSRPSITVNDQTYSAQYVFSSILAESPLLTSKDKWLLQHFRGWVVETHEDYFDPQKGTLMDFRVDQQNATAFCYVLPYSQREALVEYTVFSEDVLDLKQYESELEIYLREKLGLDQWSVRDREYGVIPMTTYRFPESGQSVIYIGTAGGQTKGSSGYTFKFIQDHSRKIVNALAQNREPKNLKGSRRFNFYDRVLLDVLAEKALPGHKIFTQLFRKNSPSSVLSFLDNESSLPQELKIISSLPFWPFTRAASRQFF